MSYRLLARVVPVTCICLSLFGWLLQPGAQPGQLAAGRSSTGFSEAERLKDKQIEELKEQIERLKRSSATSFRPRSDTIESHIEAERLKDKQIQELEEQIERLKEQAQSAADTASMAVAATVPEEIVRQEESVRGYSEAERLKDNQIEELKEQIERLKEQARSVAQQAETAMRSRDRSTDHQKHSRDRKPKAVAESVAAVLSKSSAVVPPPGPIEPVGELDCEIVYEKTTIVGSLLVDALQPLDSASQCGRRCKADARCYSFAWHGYLESDGAEDTRYSRKCFMFGDAHPNKAAHSMVTAGECPETRWSCGADPALQKTVENHPALHDHLGGHEYFGRTMEVINFFGRQRLENKTFLEIGYGLALAAVVMRGFNTQIYATEPYPVPWTPKRHGPFYNDLLKSAREAVDRGDLAQPFDLEKAADFGNKCGNDAEGVHMLQTTLEELDGIPDGSLDISYSLAVLEHISKVDESFEALARKMRVGGLSCHQIDMRDHGSFDKPWEFLLDDAMFEARINLMGISTRHPYFGNRVRLSEFMAAAGKNGFQTVHLARNHVPATEEGLRYVEESIAKLRKCQGCRYQNWTRDDLDQCTSNKMPMTGVFWCVRYLGAPPPEDDEKPPCGSDMWSRSDFQFMNMAVRKNATSGFQRVH